jgi:hypothetical protein
VKRKPKKQTPTTNHTAINVMDSVNFALELSKSVRAAMAVLGGNVDFGPMVIAALNRQADLLEEAQAGLRKLPIFR